MSQSPITMQVYDRVPSALHPAARALACASFQIHGETDAQRAERRDRFPGQGDAVKHVLALKDDEVVGLAIAFRRVVDRNGRSLVLGGLGDVCVAPDCRRQGIASRLTEAAMRELALTECEVAYLCAGLYKPGLTELYGRAGFARLDQGHTYLGASGTRYVDRDGMIAPVRSRELFEEILQQREPFDIGRGNW